MKAFLAVTGAVAIAVMLGAAPRARADDQSYLDYLAQHHNDVTGGISPPVLLLGGHRMCMFIQGGMTPPQAAATAGSPLGPAVTDAAQHELCPDTLQH
ncbi:hypothetical protein MAAFP003_2513 [Mycobacterium ahvazicum]|uniref:Uncharacterized protein n=1 Tax=Mycobacterium ahvazicum TaxID=1964395 RepID=A0A2K4YAR6_9MYCO|nr:DUF732 domain-containing protein [Mycobacterium ahvazicum]SOX53837.1 hypothetical protein MAAFP003_2513 [Mycobacterium ahvazicum]